MAVQPDPQTDFVPADEFVVENLETLKVLADPLRIRMLDLMRDPCTVKQIAAELDIPPTKLYYHITQLEKHQLIVLVDTQIVSGIIEKHYQAAAQTIRVKRQLLSPSPGGNDGDGLELTITSLWQDVIANLRESATHGMIDTSEDSKMDSELNPSALNLRSNNLALKPEQMEEFLNRYDALLSEYHQISETQFNSDNAQLYKLFSVSFPSSRKRYPHTPSNSDAI